MLLFVLPARANNSKCILTTQDIARNAQVEMTGLGKGCAVYITPVERSSLTYRSYLFTDDGMVQVFNSYGNGNESNRTGARVYAIFPRTRRVSFNISVDRSAIRVLTTNANTMFKIRTSPHIGIENVTGSEFFEDAHISAENNGGVELMKNQFFYMDAGFGLGTAPQSNAHSSSTFHDIRGKQCVVANRSVFDYRNGDAHLKSDSDIRKLLARNCPDLQQF